jgi:hypothetical protein
MEYFLHTAQQQDFFPLTQGEHLLFETWPIAKNQNKNSHVAFVVCLNGARSFETKEARSKRELSMGALHTGLNPFALLCIQKTKYFSVCVFCVLLRAISRRTRRAIDPRGSHRSVGLSNVPPTETRRKVFKGGARRLCHFLRSFSCIMLTSCVCVSRLWALHAHQQLALQSHRVGTMDARKGRSPVLFVLDAERRAPIVSS